MMGASESSSLALLMAPALHRELDAGPGEELVAPAIDNDKAGDRMGMDQPEGKVIPGGSTSMWILGESGLPLGLRTHFMDWAMSYGFCMDRFLGDFDPGGV